METTTYELIERLVNNEEPLEGSRLDALALIKMLSGSDGYFAVISQVALLGAKYEHDNNYGSMNILDKVFDKAGPKFHEDMAHGYCDAVANHTYRRLIETIPRIDMSKYQYLVQNILMLSFDAGRQWYSDNFKDITEEQLEKVSKSADNPNVSNSNLDAPDEPTEDNDPEPELDAGIKDFLNQLLGDNDDNG